MLLEGAMKAGSTSSSPAAPALVKRRCSIRCRASSRTTSASSRSKTRRNFSCSSSTSSAWKPARRISKAKGDHGDRPCRNCSAYAARPDHHRRMPRSGNARHAAGDEHGSRRFADHRPRQHAARRDRASRNDDHDGRLRHAHESDASADFQRRRPDRPGQPSCRAARAR